MSRKLYVLTFIAFATAFVPVFLYFGIVDFIVPSAWIAAFVGGTLFRGKFTQSLWAFGQLAGYLLLFYIAARAAFWLASLPKSRALRLAIQIIILFALFSCSFFRVITYSSLGGQGGTYTFWGAVSRYLERHDSR